MDNAQRTVLQKNHMELAQDIVMTEDLLGIFYQENLFDANLCDIIRSQSGTKAPTYKMLELLPTRGPGAFQKFLKIIETDYHWLAKKLKSDLEEEVCKLPHKELSMVASSVSLQHPPPNNNINKITKDVEMVSMSTQNNQSVSRSISLSNEPAAAKDSTDTAIHLNGYNTMKKKVGNFMTQQFSLSRKLCQADKQAIESFLIEQIRDVQKHCNQKVSEVRDHRRLNDDIQKWLHDNCRKLERYLGHVNHRDTMDGGFYDGKSSMKDLEDCIHMLSEQHRKMDMEVKKCFLLFGDHSHENYSLAFLVESNLNEKKKLKKENKKLQQENELMVSENYELSTAKQKLQHTSSYKDVELEVKERQIKNLQSEKIELKKEIERLYKLHVQHMEKEKTLINLQQMVQTLQEKNSHLTDESEQMKNKMLQDDLRRNSPRRVSSIPKTSRNNYPKYKSPTRKKTKN